MDGLVRSRGTVNAERICPRLPRRRINSGPLRFHAESAPTSSAATQAVAGLRVRVISALASSLAITTDAIPRATFLPRHRTHVVAWEKRSLAVASENRTFTIEPQRPQPIALQEGHRS